MSSINKNQSNDHVEESPERSPAYLVLSEYFKNSSVGKMQRAQTIKMLYSKKCLFVQSHRDFEILQKYFKRHGVNKESHSKVISLLFKQKKLFVRQDAV